MGAEFTFYDYVDLDGKNVIKQWLDDLPDKPKALFTKWLLHLEATPPGMWRRPHVDTLTGHCDGLFEIRVPLQHVQYRLLAAHRGGQRIPVLLHGFIKPGDEVPEGDCDEAFERLDRVKADPKRHVAEHDYG